MEAFVVLIAECLAAPLLAGFVIAVEAVLAMAAGLLNWKKRAAAKTGSKFLRWTTVCLLGLLTFTVIGTFAVNAFWFEPAVRLVLERVEERKGIRVTFESATGNLFTGKLDLAGATIERSSHPSSTFYLTAKHIAADLDMWQIVRLKPVLEFLHIDGIDGTFERAGKNDQIESQLDFIIEDLTLGNANLLVKDQTGSPFPKELKVRIDTFQSHPFRSTHMAYDALLRSTISGNINGSPFKISKNPGDGTHMSSWNLQNLRLDQFGDFMLGSWNVIGEGVLTIEAQNTFLNTRPATIDMSWKLKFSGIQLHRPARLLKRYFKLQDNDEKSTKEKGKEFSLAFSFDLSEDQFMNRPSLEAAGVWKLFREKFAQKASDAFSDIKEKTRVGGDKARGKFSDYFNKERGEI